MDRFESNPPPGYPKPADPNHSPVLPVPDTGVGVPVHRVCLAAMSSRRQGFSGDREREAW